MTLSAFALFLASAAADPAALDSAVDSSPAGASAVPEFLAADVGNITHGRSLVSPGCQQCCSTGNCYRAFQARRAIRRASSAARRTSAATHFDACAPRRNSAQFSDALSPLLAPAQSSRPGMCCGRSPSFYCCPTGTTCYQNAGGTGMCRQGYSRGYGYHRTGYQSGGVGALIGAIALLVCILAAGWACSRRGMGGDVVVVGQSVPGGVPYGVGVQPGYGVGYGGYPMGVGYGGGMGGVGMGAAAGFVGGMAMGEMLDHGGGYGGGYGGGGFGGGGGDFVADGGMDMGGGFAGDQ